MKLTQNSNCYYIEQSTISSKETLNSLTIYSRFKKFQGSINNILMKQHLNGEITLAIPLQDNQNILLFEYSGGDAIAFSSLLLKLAKEHSSVLRSTIIRYDTNRLDIILEVDLDKSNLNMVAQEIDEKLQNFLIKDWRVLPNNDAPELGNLLILPREIIDNPWEFDIKN